MNKPQPFFQMDVPDGFTVWPFDGVGNLSQETFFKKMGFKEIYREDLPLLYYPINKTDLSSPIIEFNPKVEDEKKACLFDS